MTTDFSWQCGHFQTTAKALSLSGWKGTTESHTLSNWHVAQR
jgi:hypothetical protein